MTLILVSYLALMAACLWFALDYLIAHGRLLVQGTLRGSAVGYVALGLGVLGILLLLVKPIFHASPTYLAPVQLRPDQQPLLFEYLGHLCRALQTPMPVRVSVTLAANASASVRRHLRRGFRPELEMTLGLPLLAAMDVRNISSVMAHELGHFTRRRSAQVIALIHGANLWFARSVYERDRFDHWLEGLCARSPWIVRPPFLLARLFLRVGRGILWVFMALGRLGTCMISRADEYNSDRYAVRLCGAEVHAAALQKTSALSVILGLVLGEVRQTWEDKRLPDDLPRFVSARAERMDRAQRCEFLAALRKERTGWFSTHPCLADRIRAVGSFQDDPPIRSSRPAADLIADFPRLCRNATISFYRHVLGEEFQAASLVPAESILREHADLSEAHKALGRYYQGEVLAIRPIYPGSDASRSPEDPGRAREALIEARRDALGSAKELQERMREFASLDSYLYQILLVRRLTAAGVQIDPRPELGLDRIDHETIHLRESGARGQAEGVLRALARLETTVRTRMTRALRLIRTPDRVGTGVELAQVNRLLETSGALERAHPTIRAAACNLRLLLTFMQVDLQNGHALAGEVERIARALRENLACLQDSLRQAPFPFEHGKPGATLSGYLFDQAVIAASPPVVAGTAMTALDRVDLLIWRVLAQLARTAERVEASLGLAPSGEPEEEPMEELAFEKPPLYTHPALQAPVAALILGLIVTLGYGVAEAAPKFAVLPKHDQYRPVMVSVRWTPPPREDIWHNGFRGYRPADDYPANAPRSWGDLNAFGAPQMDPWGRLVPPDPWGQRTHYDPMGRPSSSDPWGRPSVEDPSGRSLVPDPFGQPGVPRLDPARGYDPTRSNRQNARGMDPSAPHDPRPPGYQPFGPTPPQPGGFGPSPLPPRNPRR